MLKRISIVLLLLASVPCFGESIDESLSRNFEELKAKVASVNLDDGVSMEEVEPISEYFFHHYEGIGCGARGEITETNDNWQIQTLIGFGAEPGDPIIISKTTGAISWGGEVCIENPLKMVSSNPPKATCAGY